MENSLGTIGLQVYNGVANSTEQATLQNKGFLIGTNLSTTPIPPAFPLFASGLGALGLLGWRRKRKKTGAMAVA